MHYTPTAGAFQNCTTPRLYSAEGATTITYQSNDNWNNLEALKTATFYIDTVSSVTTVAVPSANGNWYNGTIILGGTPYDVTSRVDRVEISFDRGATWQTAIGDRAVCSCGRGDV